MQGWASRMAETWPLAAIWHWAVAGPSELPPLSPPAFSATSEGETGLRCAPSSPDGSSRAAFSKLVAEGGGASGWLFLEEKNAAILVHFSARSRTPSDIADPNLLC